MMEASIEDRPVGQIINWYLVQASKGGHRDDGQPEDVDTLKRKWAAADRYLQPIFRARPFLDLDAIEMQRVIDDVAVASEGSAHWIKRLLSDVEKFAVRNGVLSELRTKRLISPVGSEKPRPLNDAAFRRTWEALHVCATEGPIAERAPCFAILVSTVTLQPLDQVVSMRRDEVDFGRHLWIRHEPDRYVHLPAIALELISKAIDLGDFSHRDVRTDFVFASGGSKRDPARPFSYSLAFEVVKRHLGKSATPHDLRETGVASLRSLGGVELRKLVRSICRGDLDTPPDSAQMALVDGWAARVRHLTVREFR